MPKENFKSQSASWRTKVKSVVFFFQKTFNFLLAFLIFNFLLFNYVHAQSTSACGQNTSNPRTDGLITAKGQTSSSVFWNNSQTCAIDPSSAYVSYKVPSYADLKSIFFTQTKSSKTTLSSQNNLPNLVNQTVYYWPNTGDFTLPSSITCAGSCAATTSVIFFDGNLNITNNLSTAANLVLIAQGDINISANVSSVNAILVSEGNIYTAGAGCIKSSVNTGSTALVISGSLVSLNPTKAIVFCRTLTNNNNPAEQVLYQPKFTVYLKDIFSQTYEKWTEVAGVPVVPPTPGPAQFTLSNPGAQTVQSSKSVSPTLNLTYVSGNNQTVSLTYSSPPTGVSFSLSKNSCLPNCQVTLTISTTASTPPVTNYPVTVSTSCSGCANAPAVTFYLTVASSPVTAACYYSPTSISAGNSATLYGSASGGTGTGYTYQWYDTGHGTFNSSTASYQFYYPNAGTFNGYLTVTDSGGHSSTQASCGSVTVITPPPGSFNMNTIQSTDIGCSGTTPYINISWTAASNATTYNLYRNNTYYLGIAAPQTTYQDISVTPGSSYSYYVIAQNSYGSTISTNSTNTITAPGCGTPETPLQAAFIIAGTAGPYNYVGDLMGYHFKPTVNGTITKLWMYSPVAATKTVNFYNYSTQQLLATTSITTSGGWASASIPPVIASTGTDYLVAVNETDQAYIYYSSVYWPLTVNHNYLIGSGYYWNIDGTGGPIQVYGLVDVTFVPNTFYQTPTVLTQWGTQAPTYPNGSGQWPNGSFKRPTGVTTNGSSVWVADYSDGTVQQFDTSGNFYSQWGYGLVNLPEGIAVSSLGYIYVTDTSYIQISRFDTSGNLINQFNGCGGCASSPLNNPSAVAVSPDGNTVYVASSGSDQIYVFNADGSVVKTIWGTGYTINPGFKNPQGITTDSSGNVYVADAGNKRIVKLNSSGTILATWGNTNTGGQLYYPVGIDIDSRGYVYVMDNYFGALVEIYDSNGNYINQFRPSPSTNFSGNYIGVSKSSCAIFASNTNYPGVTKISCP